jgi:hypothetical protein
MEYLSEGEIPSLIATALDTITQKTSTITVPIDSLTPLTVPYSTPYITTQLSPIQHTPAAKRPINERRIPREELYRDYAEKLQVKYGDRVSKALEGTQS